MHGWVTVAHRTHLSMCSSFALHVTKGSSPRHYWHNVLTFYRRISSTFALQSVCAWNESPCPLFSLITNLQSLQTLQTCSKMLHDLLGLLFSGGIKPTKTETFEALSLFISFCHRLHDVTLSEINLDVLEARFTCIQATVVYYNAAEVALAVTHSFLFCSASAYSTKPPLLCT